MQDTKNPALPQKFAVEDQRYLESRSRLSKKYGERELWSVIDHWPLYAGIGNLSRYLANYELLKSTLDVPGDIVEFGSWRGANLMLFAKTLKILDPHCGKVVHCFDSFEGLTQFVKEDGAAKDLAGKYRGSLEELKDMIELCQLKDDVVFHKGYVEETLPVFTKSNPAQSFSFVYIDTDLYESTRTILNELHPRLCKGGVFVFDEWNSGIYPGEGMAANEFLKAHGACYEVKHVRNARQPNLVLQKIAY